MQETQAQSLGQEDPLEKEMAICSSILTWKIPWTEEPGGSQRIRHDSVNEHAYFPSNSSDAYINSGQWMTELFLNANPSKTSAV